MILKLIDYKNKIENYVVSQEYEKKRIAGELHDTSLQTLAHSVHQLELAALFIDKDPTRAKLELASINKSIKSVIDEIRATIYDLIPMSFEDLSFNDFIEQHVLQLNLKSKIRYTYSMEDIDIEDDMHKLVIFRIIQESLNNCEKHSKAKNVALKIFSDKFLHIIIEDDGVGFNIDEVFKPNNHFGIKLLYDRVELLSGAIVLKSNENNGTTVDITIPFIN